MNDSGFMLCATTFSVIPGSVFWMYFTGIFLLILGLATIFKNEAGQARGIDRAIVFGRLCFAVPVGIFGVEHFVFPSAVAALVPSWIPGHLVWTYLVGVALIAAAVSITVRKCSVLAATLLGAMIFLFVCLIHVPNVAARPGDRFFLAILLRDLTFSAGAFAFAVAQAQRLPDSKKRIASALLRFVIAIPAVVFGVEHFLYPEFVPVIPLKQPMPAWIPSHWLIACVTGAVLIVCGTLVVVNWKARMAAIWLGLVVLAIVLLVYLPMVIAKPADIGNGLNYLVDTLMFSGTVMLLAGALPKDDTPK